MLELATQADLPDNTMNMSEQEMPGDSEVLREARFFVWHVHEEEGLVDLRLTDVVDGVEADPDYSTVRTVGIDQFSADQHEHLLLCGTEFGARMGRGTLRVLKINHPESGQEAITEELDLKPYVPRPPLTDVQITERDAWVKRIQSRALREIPEGK